MPVQQQHCSGCRYYLERKRKSGECRRFPPQSRAASETWPKVNDTDWCGEFQDREESPSR